jgi:hypothetical protein
VECRFGKKSATDLTDLHRLKKSVEICANPWQKMAAHGFSIAHVIARSGATKQSPVMKSLSYQNEVATPPKKQNGGSHSVPFGERHGFTGICGREKIIKIRGKRGLDTALPGTARQGRCAFGASVRPSKNTRGYSTAFGFETVRCLVIFSHVLRV